MLISFVNRQYLRLFIIAMSLLIAMLLLSKVAYMVAKAELAQILIAEAWEKTLQGEQQVKPWPWADTWPVARLQYTATAQEDLYVLAGATGSSLAFGPGHMMGTTKPGELGNSIVGGHRDTHFSFLENVTVGDKFYIQNQEGVLSTYQVFNTQVHNVNDGLLMLADDQNQLQLITCYPFNALNPGGPLRYIVSAELI